MIDFSFTEDSRGHRDSEGNRLRGGSSLGHCVLRGIGPERPVKGESVREKLNHTQEEKINGKVPFFQFLPGKAADKDHMHHPMSLYGLSRYGMGNQRSVSWLAAVLSYYISQLSFGIINSVEAALFPRFIGSPLFYHIELRGKEEQTRKQQKSDIRRLTVLRPGQELQHSIIAASAQHKEQELCRQNGTAIADPGGP